MAKSPAPPPSDKEARLAAALRENLKRRKAGAYQPPKPRAEDKSGETGE
ncbi:MAG: hypothetical protein AB7J28_09525 [Hyphomonadaceae bacterium]